MSDFRQIGAIALLLCLGACAPVEEPVTVTAPIATKEQEAIVPEAADTAEAIATEAITAEAIAAEATILGESDNQTAASEEVAIIADIADEDNITEAVADSQLLVRDTATAQAEESPKEQESVAEETPIEEEVLEEEPAPPPPDPFNPQILIGQPNTSLTAALGDSDYSYDNSGMTISHYRAKTCIVLAFSAPNDEITYIDVRHPVVGTQLDEGACYQELGAKKAALE